METKGLRTKKRIIAKSLKLFTAQGYFGTSIEEILKATKLTKGGLYGHFSSKKEIWYAVYDEASRIWRGVVFKDIKNISDPLERIEKVIDNVLINYMGANVFDGGAYFVPMLVEVAGYSKTMTKHILNGFERFIALLHRWVKEAEQKGILKKGLDHGEIASFIMTSFNGATTLYVATKDPITLKQTLNQLKYYVDSLRK